MVTSRVIGGSDAKHGQWPWNVAVWRRGKFVCGGVLINSEFVLTSAACLENGSPSDFTVTLGKSFNININYLFSFYFELK